jgi:phosphopantothenoylcysteine decarboxylase/phosphopantothenate--cysteine ligase
MKLVIKKSVLITAGSTWVALDKVRIISNTASGETGLILAQQLKESGIKVTLLLGPGDYFQSKIPDVRIIKFRYFPELKRLIDRELKRKNYSAVIHSAAVADYKPERIIQRKVSSKLNNWKISLVPTEKLICSLKNYSPALVAVGFKFEPVARKKELIERGKHLLKQASLDIVVANSNRNNLYQAFILEKGGKYGPFLTKCKMARCLLRILENKLN